MLILRCALIVTTVGPIAWAAPGDFPPLPDFAKRVDYVAWYDKASQKGIRENAYPLYAEFMPGLVGGDVTREDWPEFSGMLTGEKEPPAPLPWDPDKHPEWEASYQRTRETLKRYAEAARRAHSVTPSGLARGVESGRNLLNRMRFDHLRYVRQCALGTLEAAWRMKNRSVSTKRMLSAIETNLRVARQFERSLFTTEHTTACALREWTYQHIAWALAHDALAEKDVKKLRKTLQTIDGEPIDFSPAMRGEAAVLLDGLQYMYGPQIGGGGRPSLNGNRFREVTGRSMGGANRIGLGARIETDVPGIARTIHAAFGRAENLIGPTFDGDRSREIRAALDKMEHCSAATKAMCFNQGMKVAGTYMMNVQCEAQRRATQLVVEMFVYKAAKDKWPMKLSNLSKKVRKRVGEDPFSGKPFIYHMIDGAPLIYTVSRNGKDDGGRHAAEWGGHQDEGDHVFWPIPGRDEHLAAGRLLQTKDKDLTPFSAIGDRMAGKTVTVAGEVGAVSSEPSAEYGRLYTITLTQTGDSIEVIYDRALSRKLSAEQKIEPGKSIRVTGVVEKTADACRLRLQKPGDLVVED